MAKQNAKGEPDKKKKALENVKNAVQSGAAYKKSNSTNAARTVQRHVKQDEKVSGNAITVHKLKGETGKALTQNKSQKVQNLAPKLTRAGGGRSGKAGDRTRTVTPTASKAGNSGAFGSKRLSNTDSRQLHEERKKRDLQTLTRNSIRWHQTNDTAERAQLKRANDSIRAQYGLQYQNGKTYLPTAGGRKYLSKPVDRFTGHAAAADTYDTQAEKQARYDEIQSEIDRLQEENPYLLSREAGDRKGAAALYFASHPSKIGTALRGAGQYDRMTDEEKKNADALYAYYQTLVNEQNALANIGAGKTLGGAAATTGLNMLGVAENIGRYIKTAVNTAVGNAAGLLGADDIADFYKQDAQRTIQNSLTDALQQRANDWAQPVGMTRDAQELAGSGARMIPSIVTGTGLPVVFMDAAANATRQALNEGADLNSAMAYGVGIGAVEAGTEKLVGGIPGLNEGIAKLGSKNRVLNKAFDIFGEGAEEALSTLVNPYLKRATYDKNAKNATAQELWDSAKGGMALAGIMQGANAAAGRLANRRYGNAPAETTTSIHDANADVRAAEQMDNRLHPNTSQALPTAQRLALPEGNTRTANTLYANENGGVANNLRAFSDVQTPDVLYGNMRGDFTSAPDSGSVLYASQNGQVSQTLPTGYLPEGRQTKIAAQVDETQTIPRYSVDDGGESNGGLTDSAMQWAQMLAYYHGRTGISIQQYASELTDNVFSEYNQALKSAEQYVKDYKPQGTSVVWNADGTSFRASNNEQWYSDYYKKYKKKPSKAEAANIAAQLVNRDIQRGGGQFISAELAQELKTAMDIRAAANALGDKVLSAQIVDGNLVVQRGAPARTESIQGTNASRNGSIISPATQGAPAGPINLNPMQSTGQSQSNPPLRDINPKLRTAAQAAQENAQSVQPEIAQPMQKNAQGAALREQQTAQANGINPTLKKAGVNAESSVGAAETGFDPYSKMVNDYGAIPEGMNPARMVDVPQSTNGTDRVSNVARTIMESGITPDNLIPALENHVAEGLFSHDVKSLKKTLSGATRTIQKKGWQGAFDQWEEVTDGRRAVTDDDIALGQMMYTAAVEAGDTQTAMKLAGDLAVQGTALGRGVNAFKLLKKTTPEGQLYYLQKAVQKIQQEYQSRFDKQARKAAKKQGVPAEDIADQYGLKLNEDLVQEFLNAETQEARDAVVDKIYNDVAQQIPKTAGDRLNAWRYFAMLGNPRTHIRNIMGNVASAIALDASHKVSAAGQKLFLPQEKRTRTLHTSKTAHEFAKADYANVEAELSGNAYKTEMSEIKQRQKLFPKPLQKVMDANTWALDAEDQVFKKKSYIDSMGNFLTARGWDVNNLTEAQLNEARQHAIQDAKIATFQDASALADTLSRLENKNKAWGVAIGSLVPFKRTPINVAKRSFELSPVGLLKAITYDAVQVKKGNMDATKMIDHIGQGLTGSSVAALGAFLAAQGIFSAGSSDDDKEANFDAGMGQQEYAINIGGKSYTIDWASPNVVPLAMGGELYEALHQKYDDEETAFNQAMATVSRMFDPMLNMTMLSGIGSTVTSAAYNKSNPLFGIASNVATNFGGQFVPTLFGQVARTVDNTRRTTYADKNSPVPSSVQKFLQRQANKIPGLSQNQPAYTDVWGREQKNGPDNVFARAAYNFLSPGYLADAKSTQAEKALKELYQATGDNSVLPSKPQKYYKDADGVKKFLSASDYSKLTSEGGRIALDALDKLTKSEAYKGMTNDEKIEAVADVYKYAKAVAANKTYGKELDGTTKIVSESGIEPGLYYAYKEMEDSLNNDMEGWEARDQTFNSIKSDKSLSEQEKNSLYHTLLIKGTSDSQWEKYQEISGKVTAEEYVDAMIQKQAITKEGETIEKGRAALEATEFSYYLDSKGYTGEKRQALENTFKFYSMVKADPANYTFDMIRENGGAKEKAAIGEVESAGISAAQYAQIKSAASGVTYEKGKSGAKLAAVAKVVSQNTANYNEYAAVMHALGYKKIDGHYTSGGKLPEDSGLNTGINVNRSSASQKTSSAGFVNPTTASNSVVTSGYGGRNAPKTSGGYGSSNHDGIDIGGTGGNLNGQAADSIGGGKVTEVGYDENGYGNYVVVDHGNGYTSLYGHLQKATVKQGETVSAGQQVGVIGSTGNSSGPHLHLRVRKNGQSIDPRTVIPGYGG